MEFTKLYKTFKPESIDILLKNGDVYTGSGGSNNYIIVDKEQVLKIIPNFKKPWDLIQKYQNNQEEIKFYKFFTNNLILKNKTPHIVGSYKSIKINLKTLIDKYYKYCKDNNTDEKIKTKFENLITKHYFNTNKHKKNKNNYKKNKNFIYKLINLFKSNSKKTVKKQKKNINTKKNNNLNKTKKYNKIEENVTKTLCNYKINKCGTFLWNQELDNMFDGVYLENCSETISNYFYNEILNNKLNSDNIPINTEMFINRIIFQYSFTMCAIYDVLPNFIHNDMFLRNIMARVENKYSDNDFVEYIYKKNGINKDDKIVFYLPANGIYIKINDFGWSLANPKIGDKMLSKGFINREKCIDKYTEFHPNMSADNTHNNDTFNFLHDLYDGANFAQDSLMNLIKNNKTLKNKVKIINSVKNTIKQYLDIDIIDKINEINKNDLDRIWNINNIPELEATIQHPLNYLKNNFKMFNNKPNNATIINTYIF